MHFKKLISIILISLTLPTSLTAAPQDLETFFDFENETATGTDFILGVEPFTIRVIGFTLETVDNPALAHSGTKALVLEAGQEGFIILERGANLLQFYAAESNGGGRLELRERNRFVLRTNGMVEGLPVDISPGANPSLQSFVGFSGDINDDTDLTFTSGVIEIKIINVSGRASIDDLGFTYTAGPPNNTVFQDFENFNFKPEFRSPNSPVNFTLGTPPYTASFTGGIAATSGLMGSGEFLITPFPVAEFLVKPLSGELRMHPSRRRRE